MPRLLLVAAAIGLLLVLADENELASASGRSLAAHGVAIRYLVVGNSEANAVLTHSPEAFHLWESRATLIDRRIQLDLGLRIHPAARVAIATVNPAELAVSPYCLAFQTAWPVGRENSRLIRRRPFATYRYASISDVLLGAWRLFDAVDRYVALDPVKSLGRLTGEESAAAAYRANGSLIRSDAKRPAVDTEFDRISKDAIRYCERVGANPRHALDVLRGLATNAQDAGVTLLFVVTPLHPAYRRSLDSYLSATLPEAHVSVERLIERLHSLNAPVIDHSRAFDRDELAFLNGNHLSSHGEALYEGVLTGSIVEVTSEGPAAQAIGQRPSH